MDFSWRSLHQEGRSAECYVQVMKILEYLSFLLGPRQFDFLMAGLDSSRKPVTFTRKPWRQSARSGRERSSVLYRFGTHARDFNVIF